MRRLVELVFLVLLWIALWGDWSVGNLVGGVAVAAVVLLATPSPRRLPRGTPPVRPWATVRLAGRFVVALVKANLQVAVHVLRPHGARTPGVVAVPVRGGSDVLLTELADFITLTPGTLTLEVSNDPPVVYVHTVHLTDADALRREVLAIEASIIRAFGSPEAVAALRTEGAPR